MPSVSPELPPHLAKRKREVEKDESPPHSSTATTARPATPKSSEKRRRVIGPSLPPAPLEELPKTSAQDEEESSSDDEFGPAIPTGKTTTSTNDDKEDTTAADDARRTLEDKPKGLAWMYDPKGQDDLSQRMGLDPSRVMGKARAFNKHSSALSNSSSWNESPDERRKRLENEVLGIKTPSTTTTSSTSRTKTKADEETSRKIKENIEKHRGKSLMEEQQQNNSEDKEDDPTKRAFDYEKDIGGVRVGQSARRDMLNRAQNFGSRFSGGGYL